MQVRFDGFCELDYKLRQKNQIYDIPSILFSLTNGGNAYQDRNAIMNPNVEKKNVRPCGSNGLRMGID